MSSESDVGSPDVLERLAARLRLLDIDLPVAGAQPAVRDMLVQGGATAPRASITLEPLAVCPATPPPARR